MMCRCASHIFGESQRVPELCSFFSKLLYTLISFNHLGIRGVFITISDLVSSYSLQTDLNRKYRMHDRLERIASGPFVLSRSVFNRVKLTKGRYIIIPSTFDPRQCGEFVMRIYASGSLNMM